MGMLMLMPKGVKKSSGKRRKRAMPKRPRKPKMSSPLSVWENYERRLKAWSDKCKAIINARNKKAQLIKKYSNL